MSSPMPISWRRIDEVIDGAAIVLGVDDGGRAGGKAAEVLGHGEVGVDGRGRVEERLQRDRRRLLAGVDHLRGRARKISPCSGSKKWCGSRNEETRSSASLLTRIAPSSACSASMLCGRFAKAFELGGRKGARTRVCGEGRDLCHGRDARRIRAPGQDGLCKSRAVVPVTHKGSLIRFPASESAAGRMNHYSPAIRGRSIGPPSRTASQRSASSM